LLSIVAAALALGVPVAAARHEVATSKVSASDEIVGNPSFESGTAGWSTGGSSAGLAPTLTRVPGGHSGAYAAQLVNVETAAVTCVLNDSPNWVATTDAGRYTASLWVRADTPGASLKLALHERGTAGRVNSVITLTTSWQQVSVRYTPIAPGTSSLDFTAEVGNVAPGDTCFYADDAAIVFDRAPVASLTVTPTSGEAPLSVHADASASTATELPIASYSFDFGDGTPAVGPQAEPTADHTYAAGGTHMLRVTVTDTDGRWSSASRQVSVSGGIVGNPWFEWDTSGWNTSGSSPGVTLTRVPGGHGGTSAAQLANGGTTAASCVLNDAPNWVSTTAAGRYVASLWVRADAPGATLKLRLREYRKDTGAFVGAASSAITLTPSWQQVSVRYLPSAAGASTLDYTAWVDGAGAGSTCFDADDAAIDFKPAPAASLTVTPAAYYGFESEVPLSVHADASASTVTDLPIASYTFDFGDGSPVVGPQAESTADHIYWMPGSYRVTVTVTDTDGRSSSKAMYAGPAPSLTSNSAFESGTWGWSTSGSSPGMTLTQVPGGHSGASAARLANESTSAGACVLTDAPNAVDTTASGKFTAMAWVRADAPGATLKLKLREYRKDTGALLGAARSTVTLTTSWQLVSVAYAPLEPRASTLDYTAYIDSVPAGSTCFYADDVILRFEPGATASLSVSPATGAAPLAVRADASASTSWWTTIASYRFDFGDGSAVVGPDPTADHTYAFGGTYTITLTVADTAGRSSTTTRQVTVTGGIVGNASFESGTAGWNTSGSGVGVTLAGVPGGHSGAAAARLTNTGTAAAGCVLNDAPNWVATTAAGSYTASLWIRSDTPGATLRLKLREYRKDTGAFVGSASAAMKLTTSWEQISVGYTPLAQQVSTLDYTASVDSAAGGSTCFDADDAAIAFDAS
jgi:PKD repeat protein